MASESFARMALNHFVVVYTEIFKGEAIKPADLEAQMWAHMMARSAGMAKTGLVIPYENIKRAKVTLPYLPDQINYTGCTAIKKNGGLYTPCCGKLDGAFCKTCQFDKEGASKEIENGTIDERAENIESGKFKPISFGDWLKAHKKTNLSEVYDKLRNAGISIEIPAEELTETMAPKKRKGRPGKAEPEEEDGPVAPKKRTRKTKAKAEPEEAVPEPEPESDGESTISSKSSKSSKSKESSKSKASSKKASDELSSESEIDEEAEKPKAKPEKKSKEVKAEDPWAVPEPKKKAKEPKEKKAKESKEKKAKESKADKPEKKAKKNAAEFEMQEGDELVEVDSKQVILRVDGETQHLLDKDTGAILGHIDEEGDAVWA